MLRYQLNGTADQLLISDFFDTEKRTMSALETASPGHPRG